MAKSNKLSKWRVRQYDRIEDGESIIGVAAKYADYPDAYLNVEYDYESAEVRVVYEREETDEEYNSRMILEAVEHEKIKLKEAKEKEKAKKDFDRLRKKYGFE